MEYLIVFINQFSNSQPEFKRNNIIGWYSIGQKTSQCTASRKGKYFFHKNFVSEGDKQRDHENYSLQLAQVLKSLNNTELDYSFNKHILSVVCAKHSAKSGIHKK